MFEWEHYLEVAQEWVNESDDSKLQSASDICEAKLRSSISRAYYAAFWNARLYIEKVDHKYVPEDGSVHQYMIDYYNGKRAGKRTQNRHRIGIELSRMRNERVNADYGREASKNLRLLRSTAITIIKSSRKVISTLENGGV